jgi:hypothetical protein
MIARISNFYIINFNLLCVEKEYPVIWRNSFYYPRFSVRYNRECRTYQTYDNFMSWNNWTAIRRKPLQVCRWHEKCTVMTVKIIMFWNLMSYGSDDVYQRDSTTFIFRESQLVLFYRTRWRRRPVDPKVHIPRRGALILSLGICVRSDFKQTTTSLQITSLEVLF